MSNKKDDTTLKKLKQDESKLSSKSSRSGKAEKPKNGNDNADITKHSGADGDKSNFVKSSSESSVKNIKNSDLAADVNSSEAEVNAQTETKEKVEEKADLKELKKLREKCRKLGEKNEELELKICQFEETKLEQGCTCSLQVPDEEPNEDSEVQEVIAKVKELEDADLKDKILMLINKSSISEKSFRYVHKEWESCKLELKRLRDQDAIKMDVSAKTPAEETSDSSKTSLINGNALLKASVDLTENLIKKVSSKSTKEETKSFVSKVSDINSDSFIAMAGFLLEETNSLFKANEPESNFRRENSIMYHENSVDVTKPPPNFFNPSNPSVKGGSFKRDELANSTVKNGSPNSLSVSSSWKDRGSSEVPFRSESTTISRSRGVRRGHFRNYGVQDRSFYPNSTSVSEASKTQKSFTFSNEIRKDILEFPK